MIYIVQVYRYQTNNGCSVRVGRGVDREVRLEPRQCVFFEFVESRPEVLYAIRLIERLPSHYRGRDRGLEVLRDYLKTGAPHAVNSSQFTLTL